MEWRRLNLCLPGLVLVGESWVEGGRLEDLLDLLGRGLEAIVGGGRVHPGQVQEIEVTTMGRKCLPNTRNSSEELGQTTAE